MLELMVQGETESVEERLWHADGEAVIVSLRGFDHHNAGTVDLQVVSLVQGMEVLNLGVQAPRLASLWLLSISD